MRGPRRAHEKWGLSTPPDLVSFSKKMQLGGYFTRRDYLPEQGYRIFNTWMGDPSKLVILEVGTASSAATMRNQPGQLTPACARL